MPWTENIVFWEVLAHLYHHQQEEAELHAVQGPALHHTLVSCPPSYLLTVVISAQH